MRKINILERIKGHKTISIIGMDKNVGKTTVLNYILNEARGKMSLGLTSIGRDGEDSDRVTYTEKPKIYIEKGTYVATAKQCLLNSDITKEIIKTTGINTPMGEVIITRALSDGYVELGGPSINSDMKNICHDLLEYGSELVIVDGALSRKTLASPVVTEAAILSTGASLERSINKVVDSTSYIVKLLSLETENDKKILELCREIRKSSKIGFIYEDKTIKCLDILTSLEASREICENLKEEVSHVVIKGIASDKLLRDIMKSTEKYKGVTFLIEDGTKCFAERETFYKFQKQGGILKVLNKISLICITCNPKSPYGYEFDRHKFLDELRKNISLPVFDVVGGD